MSIGLNGVDPILQGIFDEIVFNPLYTGGFQIAPLQRGSGRGLTADYTTVTSRPEVASGYPGSTGPMDWNAPSRRHDITIGSDTIALVRRAESVFQNSQLANHYTDLGSDLTPSYLGTLKGIVLDIHAQAAFTALNNTAAVGTAADPGNFNTSTVDLYSPMMVAINTISDASGQRADVCHMGRDVASALCLNDQVLQWSGIGRDVTNIPTYADLVGIFQAKFGLELMIHEGTYAGASGRLQYMGTGLASNTANNIIVAYQGKDTPEGVQSPVWARTIVNDDTPAGSEFPVRSILAEDPRGIAFVSDATYQIKVRNSAAAYMLSGVLA